MRTRVRGTSGAADPGHAAVRWLPSVSRVVLAVTVVVVVGLVVLVAVEPSTQMLGVVAMVGLGLGATGAVSIRFLRQARRGAERAARAALRDRSLLAASRRMAAAGDQHEVDAVVAEVARDLADQDGVRAVLWEEHGQDWVAIASAGPSRLAVASTARLPHGMLELLDAGEPWVLDEAESADLQAAYGLPVAFRGFVYLPLPRRRGPRAALAISCPRPPDADLPEALRRFVQEVAVAEDRAQLLAELAQREAELDSLLQGSTDIIAMLDEQGAFTYLNRAARSVHGFDPQALLGTNVFDLFHPDDRGRVLRDTLTGDLEAGVQVAHRMYDAAGRLRHVETWVSRPPGASSGYILNVRDVTERRALEAEIAHHAHHDPLTGLANRRAFTSRLDEALARFARSGTPVGLVMLDLDEFKPVNDSWGHQAGDEVLVEVARRLEDAVRDTDLVARMGGDEFAVVLEAAGAPNEVATLAARLDEALSAPIHLERGATARISASLGLASSWHGCNGDELLREADQQLYVSKRSNSEVVRLPPG